MKRILAAGLLALLSAVAWAQSTPPPAPAPAPAPSKEEPPKQPPLNLRLDDAGKYARDPAPASGPTETLPSLGSGSAPPSYDVRRGSKDPIPKDTAPDRQM